MEPMRVGVVGCGVISDIYLASPARFRALKIVACADLDPSRAHDRAQKYNVPRVLTVEQLLADPDIDAVLNLTVPSAHFSVSLSALESGKHVYVEKPLSLLQEEAVQLLLAASRRNLRVGCAPDTFLGAGLQTCRKLIDDGVIGRPVAAAGHMLGHGPERWHPDPEFFYKPGAGPLFDMGPYYLTAMVALLGPIVSVTASAGISFPQREIGAGPKSGEFITVETPTHVAGVLEFARGAIGTLTTSFDVWAAEAPRLEIYGSEGTISVPDPNTFGGPVRLRLRNEKDWHEAPLTHGYADDSRGIGLADMALAVSTGRPHRASGELAGHVLEAMHAFLQSARTRRHHTMTTCVAQPEPLPVDWPPHDSD
ncbi:MAG: Gfo/Idh/MocA family protein [Capsulimonadaceae bacterium]